ncbi:hypothetical protein [uncultured Roseobacter sp.]|uniref:hypothetical protein n=1 Tax=uncultured Roseobacter sp. TaxID=114847 RepID=UPI00262582CF|nr:hypothetical protein [uncultured Roseobacter sp.]
MSLAEAEALIRSDAESTQEEIEAACRVIVRESKAEVLRDGARYLLREMSAT